jgi:hypothetical protein
VAGRTAEHIQTRSGLEVGSLSSFNCTLAVAKLVLVMGYTSDSMSETSLKSPGSIF